MLYALCLPNNCSYFSLQMNIAEVRDIQSAQRIEEGNTIIKPSYIFNQEQGKTTQ